jgi:predicted PurR-regulated permease PerM
VEQLIPEVLKLGAPGLIIALLVFFLLREWKRSDKLAEIISELQEKRVTEASASTKALEGNTAALQVLNETVRGLSRRGHSQ